MLYADPTHTLKEVTPALSWEAPDLSEERFDGLTDEQLRELILAIHDMPDGIEWDEADMLTIPLDEQTMIASPVDEWDEPVWPPVQVTTDRPS